jgi:proline racemase
MWEARGHADMYVCMVTPPVTGEADIGVLFMHNEGYSTMCGHGIIGITSVALETGLLPMSAPETTIRIDTPAGLVTAHARVVEGRVQSVYFHNVHSFVLALVKRLKSRAWVKCATTSPLGVRFTFTCRRRRSV